jgi:cobalt-zinc-cadmium efflux system membrane fusion protein
MSTAYPQSSRLFWYLFLAIFLLAVGTLAVFFAVQGLPRLHALTHHEEAPRSAPGHRLVTVELVAGMPNTLEVPENVQKGLGIQGSHLVQVPAQGWPLTMPGSTALDPASIMRVRTRFNAQVIEIPHVPEAMRRSPQGETLSRELRAGDTVHKDDVLAVLWSIDVGSKKSDLVDALVQLRLDEQRLKDRIELWKNGNLPEDTLNQTRRDVIGDRNNYDRAERTLRVWNVPEKEIEAARQEAERVVVRKGERDKEKERLWARTELVAPRDGTIVERNVGEKEYVADNTINLFVIADVSRLLVMANPPEDQLPSLLSLKPEQMHWTLRMVGAETIEGPIEDIGYLLDPNQHTAVVKGHIDNPGRKLRAGQFVSATITMAPPKDTVEVPLTALAEDGRQSFVFVQPDPNLARYTMRRVLVTRRFDTTAYVRSRLEPQEAKLTPEDIAKGLEPITALKPGDRILTSGVLELRAALEDKLSNVRK